LLLPFKRRPFSHQEKAQNGIRQASVSIEFDGARTAGLDALMQWHGVHIDILLLACWQILLWRVTGEESITVGHVITGRKFEELQEAWGFLAKALPVRCRLAADEPFGHLVRQVDETVRDAQEWQEWFVWPEAQQAGSEEALQSLPAGFEFAEWSRQ